eukprot:765567-Hanusia_phi.AAC.1
MSPFASSSLLDCMCPAGSYGRAGNCSACPAYSSSRPGSSSIEDCFCLGGYGVRATGNSRQVTSPDQKCELITEEIVIGSESGLSCSAICGSANLVCLDEAQPIFTKSDLTALLTSLRFPLLDYLGTSSPDAPSYNPMTAQAFFRDGLPATCSATDPSNVRICRCTCADNQYGKAGNCLSCPANSQSSFQAQERSSCMCDSGDAASCMLLQALTDVSWSSGYFLNASQGDCSPCPSGRYARRMEFVDRDFGRIGSMGWTGTDKVSSCGAYGSVLGGLNVLGEHSSVSKTFTGLCPHGFVYVKMSLLLVDLVQPVTVRLYVNRQEVWSQSVAVSGGASECGKSDRDLVIDRYTRVYHTEDYVEAMIRVDYDYWEVNAEKAKTFWGLQRFSLLLPRASSSSADCSMTTPLTQTCSDVNKGGSCMRSGDYFYVYYSSYKTWWDAESFCNEIEGGGHVAYFPDDKTYDEVTSRFSYIWIGLRSPPGSAYDFRWIANGGTPSFTRWGDSPPSGVSSYETFVYMDSRQWNTGISSSSLRVLCSYPVGELEL